MWIHSCCCSTRGCVYLIWSSALPVQVYDELEVFPLNVFTQNLSRADASSDFGEFKASFCAQKSTYGQFKRHPKNAQHHTFCVMTDIESTDKNLSAVGFAVTGHVDGLGRSHIYISEVHTEGLAYSEGKWSYLYHVNWKARLNYICKNRQILYWQCIVCNMSFVC